MNQRLKFEMKNYKLLVKKRKFSRSKTWKRIHRLDTKSKIYF